MKTMIGFFTIPRALRALFKIVPDRYPLCLLTTINKLNKTTCHFLYGKSRHHRQGTNAMNLVKSSQGLQLNTPGIGKTLVFTPNTEDDALILERAAKEGYYYPLMALKHLSALSTGLTGKTNVFIPNINDYKTNSFQQVVVFVPGIAATIERRPNDVLAITRLDLSDEYKSIARGSQQKPGVYSVTKDGDAVKVMFRNNGRITSKDDRNLVISDTSYMDPEAAAKEAVKRLETLLGGTAALKCDFDLFYSPLGSKLKGMRNYNSVVVSKTYGFSGLLADAMEQSNNKNGVVWASERGGSVVLTQALISLAAKNISFQKRNHIVKMCWATSNPKPAFQAAIQMGMTADKNLLRSNSHIKAALSATIGNAQRAADKRDPYSWDDYGRELANGAMTANTVIGIGVLAGGAATGSPLLAAMGTVTGTLGALQFAYNKIKNNMGGR
ncbi:hypothetical protein [Thalassolituus oleivorans]|uniref:hypothetical protein n=1 Tax=Thalassolituus oleivorans TaxID=187493 RepID=UPI001CE33D7A|nr:hypothetical protein [Thalassolituus oleivorans]MCA6127806.1 hypothetical protein [Thalassolituus oleivorans 4BN06-13]